MSKIYICNGCGKTFIGVTNRRAKRPLNQDAVAAANRETESNCDRLDDPTTGRARAITMHGDDYLCRRVWMDAYLAALEDEPEETIPKTKTKPEDPVEPCEHVEPSAECTLLDIVAFCSHKDPAVRSAGPDGVLCVVPGGNYSSDEITLEAKIQKPCGDHPTWSVTDGSRGTGTRHQFPARADVTSMLWIPSASPEIYSATCSDHSGTLSVQIHAYPATEVSLTLDLKKTLVIVYKIIRGLEWALNVVADKFSWKVLEGKASVQAAWKEFTDERAYYAYDISAKLDPILGGELRLTLGPGKIAKLAGKIPGIGKYIKDVIEWLLKAGIYFKISGGIGLDITYKRDKPDLPKFVEGSGRGMSGQIACALGVEGGIVDDLIKVELEGAGAVKSGGRPAIDDIGFLLQKFEVIFDGLKGNVKLIFLWGVVDVNETVVFVDPIKLHGPEDSYLWRG